MERRAQIRMNRLAAEVRGSRAAGEPLPLDRLTAGERALLLAWYKAHNALPLDATDFYGLRAVMFDDLTHDPLPYLAKAREWRRVENGGKPLLP